MEKRSNTVLFSRGVAERPTNERQRGRTDVTSSTPDRLVGNGSVRKEHSATDKRDQEAEHAKTLTGADTRGILATGEKDKPGQGQVRKKPFTASAEVASLRGATTREDPVLAPRGRDHEHTDAQGER